MQTGAGNTKSEEKLANHLRIQIIDHIADIDLPYFLFEQIDGTLDELNYYKLSNLLLNIDKYSEYLHTVSRKYNLEIRNLNKQAREKNKDVDYQEYYTYKLNHQNFSCKLSKTTCNTLYTKYSVTAILTMKEYIHRRILQSSRVKQKAMANATKK